MRSIDFSKIRRIGLRIALGEDSGMKRVVAKIALLNDGKLCMGKRNDNGAYTEPGGNVEQGESPLDGIVRETYEETGIELNPDEVKPLGRAVVKNEEGEEIEVHTFQAEVDSKRTTTKEDPDGEVSHWEWFDISNGALPSEVTSNLHVPAERDLVLQALGLVPKRVQEDENAEPPQVTDDPTPAPAQSDAKLDAVKKLHKMGDKVFKALDDMAVFANENGLSDVAKMVGEVEDAYWNMKRNLAKIRE